MIFNGVLFKTIFPLLVCTCIYFAEGSPISYRNERFLEVLNELTAELSPRNVNHNKPEEDRVFHSWPYASDVSDINEHFEVEEGSGDETHLVVNLWPNGVIPYIITANYSKKNYKKIQSVLKDFEDRTCIKFVKRKEEKHFINIVSTDENDCSSEIGMNTEESQIVNLNEENCMKLSTIEHELMHAIGFDHEHSRPDRNRYVKYFSKNLDLNQTEGQNFEINPDTFKDVGVPYDIYSVMQYESYAASKEPVEEHPTLLTKKGELIEDAEHFSMEDIEEINRLYKCKSIKPK